MIRIFENYTLTTGDVVRTNKTHYLNNVMRAKIGQEVVMVNGKDGEFIGVIKKINKQFIEILIQKQTRIFKNSDFLGLIFSSIHKIDLLAKSATELGVTEFIPFRSQFCQVKFNQERFLLNVIEAVEQSERIDLPIVSRENSLKGILDKINSEQNSIVFFCDEQSESSFKLAKHFFNKHTKYYAIIGCEGGFSVDERDLIKSYDFVRIMSLGRNILRSETASAAILSIINYWRKENE
ncbi:MAG: 16S rRNA (uracil(1498)-N(3))-methyltransferase [Rickettsiales bacterium]|jgi:16S rRNA (uracil1498-N3)-methyltransferase|nr:16S rRNA (uracil(1498)-N(3))-methyltransferase [Rickettsiales bacterium]